VKPSRNVIAVRVWDHFGGAGVDGRPKDLVLEPPTQKLSLYYPDYSTDFVLGDDPYRYKRW
jgi:hypothetical protein